MAFSGMSEHGREDEVRQMLDAGLPLVLRFVEKVDGAAPAFRGTLVMDAFGTKAGTRVVVEQAPGLRFRRPLAHALDGDQKFPPLVAGDVVAFSSAYASGGRAMAGELAARIHDGMEGHVQAFTGMVKVSQSKVSKRGAFQSVTVADGAAAVVAVTVEQAAAALAAAAQRPWPGGEAGVIVRDVEGSTIEFFGTPAHLAEEIDNSGALDEEGARLEVIPAWRMPMGREAMPFEIDPRRETPSWVHGPLSRKFEGQGFKGQGFVPSLVIACDEDEWAFGGKTGKRVRAAQGVVPLYRRAPVAARRLPSAKRSYGGAVNTVKCMFETPELDEMAKARAGRQAAAKPSAPPPVAGTRASGPPPAAGRGFSSLR